MDFYQTVHLTLEFVSVMISLISLLDSIRKDKEKAYPAANRVGGSLRT